MSLFCLYKNVGFCRGNKPRVSKAFVAFWDKVYKLKYKGDKVMKKYLLLGTSLIVASSAYAEFDCTKIPTCAELGFTMSTTDCQGKQILRCPREPNNDNAVFCGGCKVGAVLCDDLQCYDADNIPSDKTPIAVVFDSANRLAIGLNDAPTIIAWASVLEDTPLPNYDTEEKALAAKETGLYNTQTLIKYNEAVYADPNYAVGYCYNYHNNIPNSSLSAGKWFLPSVKELRTILDNEEVLNLTNVAETRARFWSSTQVGDGSAWVSGILGMGYTLRINQSSVLCAIAY